MTRERQFEEFIEENQGTISALIKLGIFTQNGASFEIDTTLLPDGPEAPADEYKAELEDALSFALYEIFNDEGFGSGYEPSIISAQEIGKIEPYLLDEIQPDTFYLSTALDAASYDLETDWASGPCLIGPDDGGVRAVIHV
jgi:hypothetical protein